MQHSTISRPLGKQDSTIIGLRNNAWPEFIPFRDYDTEIRRVLCSTNAIEFLNARYRLAVKARGHFSRRGCCAQLPLSGGAFLPPCNGSNEATRTPVRILLCRHVADCPCSQLANGNEHEVQPKPELACGALRTGRVMMQPGSFGAWILRSTRSVSIRCAWRSAVPVRGQ